MDNPFDQFDAPATTQKPAGNPFDQFDAKDVGKQNPSMGRLVEDQAMQGATLGFGDEAQDAIGALGAKAYGKATGLDTGSLGDLYKEARGDSQERLKEEETNHPYISTAANLAGSVGTLGAAGTTKAGAGAANWLNSGNLAARVAKGALAGAGTGAVYGAGSASDDNRMEGAEKGAGAGAVLGGILPPALSGAKSLIGNVADRILPTASKPPEDLNVSQAGWNKARDILKSALNEEGIKPEDVAKNLEDAKQTGLPLKALDVATKNVGGVDIQGRNLIGLADAAANMPGESAAMAGNVAARGYQIKDHINSLYNKFISNSGFYKTKNQLMSDMKASTDAYNKAYEGGSIAPLESQFESALNDASKKSADAQAAVTAARQNTLTAAADKARAGNNVYGANSALGQERNAQTALDSAQAAAKDAADNESTIQSKLRQAQSDRDNGVKGAVWSPRLQQFIDQPEVQTGIKRGLQLERLDAISEGKPFNPKEYAVTGMDSDGNPQISGVPNMRLLDAGKRGLDLMIDKEEKDDGSFTQLGRSLIKFKDGMLNEMDNLNPDYSVARKQYADPASQKKMLLQGRKFMYMDPEEISDITQNPNVPVANKAAFAGGVRRALGDALTKVSENPSGITNLWKQNISGRLDALLNDKNAFGQLDDGMTHLQNMVRTNSILTRGSQTMPRQQYSDMINQQPSKIASLINMASNPSGAAGKIGTGLLSNAMQKMARNMSKDTATGIMHYLTTDDPAIWRDLAKGNGLPKTSISGGAAKYIPTSSAANVVNTQNNLDQHKEGGKVTGEPSEAQIAAGNYKKDHITIHGLNISIENPKGSIRRGVDKTGKKWQCRLPTAYGYIRGTKGADDEHIDCYIGPRPQSQKIWVIDQCEPETKKFDECKAFIGFVGKGHVLAAYRKAFSDNKGDERIKKISEYGIDQFKEWLKSHTNKYA
jgi:hypothetical protein